MSTPELFALLALQDLDSQIDHEGHRRGHLPERTELLEIEREASSKQAARSEVAATLAEVAARQSEAERELKATEERARQVNTRLYGGSVTASRELMAMASDLESLRKRASDLEDRVLALLEEREPFDSELARLDEELAVLARRRQEVNQRLVSAEAEVDASLAVLRAKRPGAVQEVAAPLLAIYDRLRARLGGVAVARLVGGRCDGCHLTLPAVELDRIRHQPPGDLEYCDQCGRVLVISGT